MGSLFQSLSALFAAHSSLQGIIAIGVSALWYFGGIQDIRRGRTATGASWMLIAAAILLAATIGFVLNREMVAAAIAFVGLIAGAAINVRSGVLDRRDS